MTEYRIENLPPELAVKIAVNPVTGCWEWQGCRSSYGYGRVSGGDGNQKQAHRVVYTLLAGPVPDGLALDHVRARGCRSRACCWPAHLEPVTQAENARRGDPASAGFAAFQRAKTHCPAGHEYTPENTFVNPRGSRECRTCKRARGLVQNMTPEQLERHRARHREYMREWNRGRLKGGAGDGS